MAKLSRFKVDAKARQDGEFVSLGDEFDNIEIKTRALTDEYQDAVAALIRRAAMQFQNRADKVPSSTIRGIRLQCLKEHVWCGEVKGAETDDGNPATWQDFLAVIEDPSGVDLFEAAAAAPLRVGQRQALDLKDAVGNSARRSKTTSNGENTPRSLPS